ncbi:MAG: TonB-dependent receptor [Ferruginibacter sp.]
MFLNRLKILFCFIAMCLTVAGFSQVTPKPVTDTTLAQEAKEGDADNIPIVSLDDNDGQDGSAQNISGQLSAGRSSFLDAVNFHFSAVRFRLRGYDADLIDTYMNGVPMENLDNGFTPYGLWGGLNDIMRVRNFSLGMQPINYAIGGIGGTNNLDTRAFRQWKQTKVSYSLSNRSYVHRVMLTKSTGWTNKGWAFSGSASRRWASEGFADGTYYDAASFYAGVDKKLGTKHILSFVGFASPTENGRQGASVQEMVKIAGTNFYNPYWGYQNGKKRNASIAKSFQPFGILTHDWKIDPKTTLITAGSYTFGKRSLTGLDWYNSADPRPDYYRYLPSYQVDPFLQGQVKNALLNDVNLRQINWDRLYQANYGNYSTVANVNGIAGNNVSGRRASYILEERVTNTHRFNLNTTLNAVVNKHIDLTAGLTYQREKNNYYKRVNDLLGAEFYVDRNQFAERDFPNNPDANQNDLNNPTRILKTGDKFGYNYNINIHRAAGWAQATVKFSKLNFFVGAEHSFTQYYREGFTRHGLNPANSFGESAKLNFYNYNVKTGVSYKLLSGNFFFVNGSYQTKAPFFENAFISPRTRNTVQNDLTSQQILSGEAGYVYNSPNVRLRATGYYTQFRKGTDILSAYSDIYRTFVNYAISNIGKTHKGIEASADVKVYKGLTLNAAAAVGQFLYDTRQNLSVTADNNSAIVVLPDNKVYVENFRVATPQAAYSAGFNYRSPKFWFASMNVNYFDQLWLGFDPLRRTYAAVEGVDPTTKLWHDIIDQKQLKSQFSVDASVGFSWLMNKKYKTLKKRTIMAFSINANNVLNNTNIVSGGFEQLRFDTGNHDVEKYSPKLFYAYGLNFSANLSVRF